jgi:hypothetical protein
MLETGSTAHDWAYGGSRYSSYKTEYGCLVEEAHTNLLTANQSTGTDSGGDTTGFTGAGTVAATISSSTTQALQGTKSLKVITSGTETGEGVSTSSVNIANTTAHTQTMWVHAPLGSQLKLTATNQGATATAGTLVTGNGAWQKVTLTGTSSSTSTVITIATVGSAQAITFYLDMLSLTATAYPLSWTIGGSTQAAETLTAPSSVLNILSDGTGEITFETEFLITNTSAVKNIIYFRESSGKNSWTIDIPSTTIRNVVYDAAGKYKYRPYTNIIQPNIFGKAGTSQKEGTLEVFVNGVKSVENYISDGGTGMLTAYPSEIYIGGHTTGIQKVNGLIRNITISKAKRSDPDITARSNTPGFGKDRQVTLHAPLQHDLKAVRVRR